METKEEHTKKELSLGLWEKYLTLWIALCIVVGLLVGRFLPEFGQFMDSLKFAQLSIPIGILLFFMMYPTVVGIQFSDVKKAARNPKPLLVTIIANWIIAPPLMTFLANTFLAGNPQYIPGLILLGLSPCTAMVMWWMFLAKGDMAQGLINTAFNALLMDCSLCASGRVVSRFERYPCAVGFDCGQFVSFHRSPSGIGSDIAWGYNSEKRGGMA